MGKSAQAFLKEADSDDFSAQADVGAEKSSARAVSEGAKGAEVAKINASAVCTMNEAEIRQRLDAFAKELARAQRERSQH